ncbi:MAG: hypothetical protein R3F05_14110 [Planctomycetota bacterium]
MRATTRTRCFAVLGLGLLLFLATPAWADDAPSDVVSLLERARAAERVEKDLAKAQALYEQVFAKAASTDAGREAGVRLLFLDAGRSHEAWLTLIGTLSEAHGATLEKVTVDRIVELAQKHLQPGEMVKTPRGTFLAADTRAVPTSDGASPADAALAQGLLRLGAPQWFNPNPPMDGAQIDLDRLLQSLGGEARPAVERWIARGSDPIPGMLTMLRMDPAAGWTVVGRMLQTQPAAVRRLLAGHLDALLTWAPVDAAVLRGALSPVLHAPNAEAVLDYVSLFLARHSSVEELIGYTKTAASPRHRTQAWAQLAWRARDDAEVLGRLGDLIEARSIGMQEFEAVLPAVFSAGPGGDAAPSTGAARARVALGLLHAALGSSLSAIERLNVGGVSSPGYGLRTLLAVAGQAGEPLRTQQVATVYGQLLLRTSGEVRKQLFLDEVRDLPVRFDTQESPPQASVVLELLASSPAYSSGRGHWLNVPRHLRDAALSVPGVWEALLAALVTGPEPRAKQLGWVLDAPTRPEWPVDIGPTCLGLVESVAQRGGRVPPVSCLEAASAEDPARYDEVVLAAIAEVRVPLEDAWIAPLKEADGARIGRWIEALPTVDIARSRGGNVYLLQRELLRLELERAGPCRPLLRSRVRPRVASS